MITLWNKKGVPVTVHEIDAKEILAKGLYSRVNPKTPVVPVPEPVVPVAPEPVVLVDEPVIDSVEEVEEELPEIQKKEGKKVIKKKK